MASTDKTSITVQTSVNAPLTKVWEAWTLPQHILQWNNASDDWHTRKTENDLRTGGSFSSRMEAKDGSLGFDLGGIYDEVRHHELIAYTMEDGRKVRIEFIEQGGFTTVMETFDAENGHPAEMQQQGWQAIMDNFKSYVETRKNLITLHFEIRIQTDPEKVQRIMLEDESYREWTSLFHPGSYFEGSWEKGSDIRFLGPSEDGQQYGMLGRIKENIPGKIVAVAHYGVIDKGQEITSGEAIAEWEGAQENYYFRKEEGETVLTVVVDTTKEYEDHMAGAWPKALGRLKEICESTSTR